MFRHGVRSWTRNFPNEPLNQSVWDEYGGLGQLTSVGIKQMTQFGLYFSKHYRELMKTPFNQSRVKAISTDYNRTIASIKHFLKGIFRNHSIQIEYGKQNENVNFILYGC